MTRYLLLFLALAVCSVPADSKARTSPAPKVSIADVTVSESAGNAVLTITKSRGKSYSTLSISTTDGSAKAGTDYKAVGISLTMGATQTSATVTVPIVNDTLVESPETFSVAVKSVRNATISRSPGVVSITDDDTPPPPPPATQVCPDNSVIPADQICPGTTPNDPPGSANNPTTGQSPGVGAPDIATADHDVLDDIMPASVPASAVPDPVGAFRFVCWHTILSKDDPTVFYRQAGASHLHDETGVFGWNANSNYGNLRTGGGGSNCNFVEGADKAVSKHNHSANRTPYWQPALLDGKGYVILVDDTVFYYKRRPSTDPIVRNPANSQYQGHAVPLPNGIKFLFGNSPGNSSAPFDGHIRYMCVSGSGGVSTDYGSNMVGALTACKGLSTNQFEVRAEAPDCWDGVNLDTTDHRSHLAYGSYGTWGYYKCDSAHPYVIPAFTYVAQYTIAATDDPALIHFSSDEMDNTKPRGWSFHVDYGPMAWDPVIAKMWQDNCIEKILNCSSGNLGNGYILKGATVPIYLLNGVYTTLWKNPVRLVPVP